MPNTKGHIELERTIDSITVGIRHRKQAGDIDALYRLGANPYLIRRVFRARFKI